MVFSLIKIVLWLVFFFGFRYLIGQLQVERKFLNILDKVKIYLFKKQLEDISEYLLASTLIGLMFIQIYFNIPTINLVKMSTVESLGFIVGIFSMYGIYIGFLQYLAGDVRSDIYLGKSKVNYLIEKSFWYYLTQSKIFILMMITTVAVPIFVKLNVAYTRELIIIWQTSFILLLIIYVFLLSMSLYIIRVALLIKSKEDENLKYNMKKYIQQDYAETFWIIFQYRDRYENDFIQNKLKRDFIKMDSSEYEEFVKNVFYVEHNDDRNLYGTLYRKIDEGFKLPRIQKIKNKFSLDHRSCLKSYQAKNDFDLGQEWKSFYKYFKTFIFGKWNFLKQYKNYFTAECWRNLILQDLRILDSIIKKDPTSESLKIEYPNKEEIKSTMFLRDEKIREFLFNLLINKEGIDLDKELKSINEEIRKFQGKDDKQFCEYTYDFLKFKLKAILDKYKNGDANIELPKFKKLSDYNVFKNGKRNDDENSMRYSEICFNYLDSGRIEDFSQSKIKKIDNDEQRKHKIKAQKIKDLISSLNEEYRLAFMLYQLFYTDGIQFDNNLEFYDTEIKKIMNYDEQYHDYLFEQVKKILLTRDIKHRITEDFLNKLWTTRNDIITDFDWFDQFGTQHRMSDFKIFYVQSLLAGKKYSYSKSRFDIEGEFPGKRERIGYFCREYLILTDKLDTIFEKQGNYGRQNNVQFSVEYLLHSGKLNLSDIIDNLSVTSLLRLEWILRWNYYPTREFNYSNRTFFDELTSNSRYFWSGGNGILEFYIVKIIDSFYHDLYQDREFIAGFKYHLESQLNLVNKTVEEYVESIAEKVSGINNISILQEEQTISRLNDILFGQSNRIKASQKRKYRYK